MQYVRGRVNEALGFCDSDEESPRHHELSHPSPQLNAAPELKGDSTTVFAIELRPTIYFDDALRPPWMTEVDKRGFHLALTKTFPIADSKNQDEIWKGIQKALSYQSIYFGDVFSSPWQPCCVKLHSVINGQFTTGYCASICADPGHELGYISACIKDAVIPCPVGSLWPREYGDQASVYAMHITAPTDPNPAPALYPFKYAEQIVDDIRRIKHWTLFLAEYNNVDADSPVKPPKTTSCFPQGQTADAYVVKCPPLGLSLLPTPLDVPYSIPCYAQQACAATCTRKCRAADKCYFRMNYPLLRPPGECGC